MEQLTSKQIVKELDNYIIGQAEAKKAVAIALRNRYRRTQLKPEDQEEITPKNIIMKGPTGVGKTEIARRLAKLVKAPFIKVEATKYTEVGYVGRDVESMIRDLVEISVRLVKEEKAEEVKEKARTAVNKRLKDAVLNSKRKTEFDVEKLNEFKEKLDKDFEDGKLEDTLIEIEVDDVPKNMPDMNNMAMGIEINFGDMLGGLLPGLKKKVKRLSVKEARKIMLEDESDKLIDQEVVKAEAIRRAEQEGIVFIDEFDKIAIKNRQGGGSEVSREGVQRDILPIVEGSSVSTKYGTIKTDYILFIAAGAFHMSKPEDLIPELQGRFPIRVELASLKAEDFKKILTEPKHNIITQSKKLLEVDNIKLSFSKDAINELAGLAEQENDIKENIGARRLHTILEKLLEEISYNADGSHPVIEVKIDAAYVKNVFKEDRRGYNLKKYVL